ncbi:MAG: class I SAM-dependent methyltransferase [Pseudomonadota bacterium]
MTLETARDAAPFTPLGKIADALGADALDPAARERAHALAAQLDPYTERMTSAPSDALSALEEATRSENWDQRHEEAATSLPLQQTMLSGHVEGQFLSTLIRFGRARRALEIGMFTGYGALAMAEAMPDDGTVVALEIDEYAARFAQTHFDTSPHGHKIDVRLDEAARALAKLGEEGQPFDFIFIDADKGGYIDYYEAILTHALLAPDGLICVDNTLLGGEAYLGEAELAQPRSANGEAIADFNNHVARDIRTEQVMLPVRDGVTLIQRAR